jgi:hypothetical protein
MATPCVGLLAASESMGGIQVVVAPQATGQVANTILTIRDVVVNQNRAGGITARHWSWWWWWGVCVWGGGGGGVGGGVDGHVTRVVVSRPCGLQGSIPVLVAAVDWWSQLE